MDRGAMRRSLLTRRAWIAAASSTAAAAVVGAWSGGALISLEERNSPLISAPDEGDGLGTSSASTTPPQAHLPLPVAFISHSAPPLARDAVKGADFTAWSAMIPTPRAILIASAHWQADPSAIGATRTTPLIYDFFGFPEELSALTYPAPGAPLLASRVEQALNPRWRTARRDDRGLDHGVWVPLLHMYPRADVPVLQLGWPRKATPAELFALGRALGPLRAEGVLIVASGGFVHNLGQLDWGGRSPAPAWAEEFEAWGVEVLGRGDFDALIDFRDRAPARSLAHPTDEHFLPLLIAAGAASEGASQASFPVQGFEYGSLSRRCVQFG
jgi:4,5-DOPA dioxygenase extradiol